MSKRRKVLLYSVFSLAAVYVILLMIPPRQAVEPHAFYQNAPSFTAYAHRFSAGQAPENTLFAAKKIPQDKHVVLEGDVHASKDGVLILHHDVRLDRTTNGNGPVTDKSLDELKQLDAGYHFSIDQQSFPERGNGVKITTVEELFKALPDRRFALEIKQKSPAIDEKLCALIRKYNVVNQVIVASFDSDTLSSFRQHCPKVATSLSFRELVRYYYLDKIKLGHLYPLRGVSAQIPVRFRDEFLITPELLQGMHERGIRVEVWTVNDPTMMKQLIDAGVDGIMTDYIDKLLKLINQ